MQIRKTLKTAEYEKLNEALYLRFTQQREKVAPLSELSEILFIRNRVRPLYLG
jgi:hypothetical protein